MMPEHLRGRGLNPNRTAVTVALPKAQLEPAVLDPSQSYVFAQQQGAVQPHR